MNPTIKIVCENIGSSLHVAMGTSLFDVIKIISLNNEYPFLAAYVNNDLKGLAYKIYSPESIRFIDVTHFEGFRVYQRTLLFVLNKAIKDLYPDNTLIMRHSVSNGFYCELDGRDELSKEEIGEIKKRADELVEQDIPIVKEKMLTEEAKEIYRRQNLTDKIELMETRPQLYTTLYHLANVSGSMFGTMAPSSKYVEVFGLTKYYHGFHISFPKRSAPDQLSNIIAQDKMFDVFNEYKDWVSVIGVLNVGSLNNKVLRGESSDLIKIAEAFHERKISQIADHILKAHNDRGIKMITIAGPSSSGKTTFTKRLEIQLRIFGLRPVMISLDDYFVNREDTPKDKSGEYNYESTEALDLGLFNDNIKRLFDGESVSIPRYNFITGQREAYEEPLLLDDRSVLVIEGIHGLNPILTERIDSKFLFKIYISALTSTSLDNLSRIATTDSRLLRRIVRDYTTRGSKAVDTLRRWSSVRAGEDRYIFPYQENADVMFNSSIFYETSVLRKLAEPMLHEVPDTVPEYGEARRLLSFLKNFIPIDPGEIPPTSLLREFIGGGSFKY